MPISYEPIFINGISFLHQTVTSLSALEDSDALYIRYLNLAVQPFEPFPQTLHRLKRRRKESFPDINTADPTIGMCVAALRIEAAAENTAGLQDTEGLAVRRFFVREGVKAIKLNNGIKSFIFERQVTHIALPERDIAYLHFFRPLLGSCHHLFRVVEAGDIRIG